MRIRLGDGGRDDMASEDVLRFIKSHRIKVRTRDGEEKEVPPFRWDDLDRARGMGIDVEAPGKSREQ